MNLLKFANKLTEMVRSGEIVGDVAQAGRDFLAASGKPAAHFQEGLLKGVDGKARYLQASRIQQAIEQGAYTPKQVVAAQKYLEYLKNYKKNTAAGITPVPPQISPGMQRLFDMEGSAVIRNPADVAEAKKVMRGPVSRADAQWLARINPPGFTMARADVPEILKKDLYYVPKGAPTPTIAHEMEEMEPPVRSLPGSRSADSIQRPRVWNLKRPERRLYYGLPSSIPKSMERPKKAKTLFERLQQGAHRDPQVYTTELREARLSGKSDTGGFYNDYRDTGELPQILQAYSKAFPKAQAPRIGQSNAEIDSALVLKKQYLHRLRKALWQQEDANAQRLKQQLNKGTK